MFKTIFNLIPIPYYVFAGIIILLLVGNYLTEARYEREVAKLSSSLETTKASLAEAKLTVEVERETAKRLTLLLEQLTDSDKRISKMFLDMQEALKALGDDHAKKDPCYYAVPDPSTLDAISRVPHNI